MIHKYADFQKQTPTALMEASNDKDLQTFYPGILDKPASVEHGVC